MARAKKQQFKKVDFTRHPASAAWGDMNEAEYAALVQSIKDDGYRDDEPVLITKDQQVVDGWHRLQAATDAGVAARIVQLTVKESTDEGIARLVISRHAARRNLTQVEIAKRTIATMKACGQKMAPSRRPTKAEKAELEKAITAKEVAEAANVSKATARRAIVGVKEDDELDADAVKRRAERKGKSARKRLDDDQSNTLMHYKELAETLESRVRELELVVSEASLDDLKAEWKRASEAHKKERDDLRDKNRDLRQRVKDAEAEAAHYKAYAAEMEAALKKAGGK